jgi:APA family basic amino acid/polyamine antiporter
VVVLICLLAQPPRLTYGMAQDGLLPEIFSRTDDKGNLNVGTWIAGIGMTFIATCIPFTYLDDLISAGVLVAFSLTDSSLVVLRCDSPAHRPFLLETCLILYNGLCFTTTLLLVHGSRDVITTLSALATVSCAIYMSIQCPPAANFGGSVIQGTDSNNVASSAIPHPGKDDFHAPLVPFIPCLGMAANWYLIAQLEVFALALLALYLGATICLYLTCCLHMHAPIWWPVLQRTRSGYHSIGESTAASKDSENPEYSMRNFHAPRERTWSA